jgi:L-alanine-DL-glutamate epimerase-like enolase superfamily enzyme
VPFIEKGLTNYSRLDICNVGGFTEAMKVAGWCEAHYIDMVRALVCLRMIPSHISRPAICSITLTHAVESSPGRHCQSTLSLTAIP